MFGAELVSPRFGVRDPHNQLHDHRLRLVVDHDLFTGPARRRTVRALPLHPLREDRQAPLERLLRLARALLDRTAAGAGDGVTANGSTGAMVSRALRVRA